VFSTDPGVQPLTAQGALLKIPVGSGFVLVDQVLWDPAPDVHRVARSGTPWGSPLVALGTNDPVYADNFIESRARGYFSQLLANLDAATVLKPRVAAMSPDAMGFPLDAVLADTFEGRGQGDPGGTSPTLAPAGYTHPWEVFAGSPYLLEVPGGLEGAIRLVSGGGSGAAVIRLPSPWTNGLPAQGYYQQVAFGSPCDAGRSLNAGIAFFTASGIHETFGIQADGMILHNGAALGTIDAFRNSNTNWYLLRVEVPDPNGRTMNVFVNGTLIASRLTSASSVAEVSQGFGNYVSGYSAPESLNLELDNWAVGRLDTVAVLPATDIGYTNAIMNGQVLRTNAAGNLSVYLCWDTTDQGTASTGDWAHVIAMGGMGVGTFGTNVTGLLSDSAYQYRCFATNSAGGYWSYAAASFQTANPNLRTATNSGAWDVAANWEGGRPGAGDTVVIPPGVSMLLTNATEVLNLCSNAGTLTFAGLAACLNAASVVVPSGGVITHVANSATTTNASGDWDVDGRVYIVCSNLTVESGGAIDVAGKGYAGDIYGVYNHGLGPGGAVGGEFICGNGGGHGGKGGNAGPYRRDVAAVAAGMTYDSLTAPSQPGSGGAALEWNRNPSYAANQAGFGGGVIRIVATNVTLNGAVMADGGSTHAANGGGSGGAIHISCRSLTGVGTISAAGGPGKNGSGSAAGGGGGRVALHYETIAFSGSILLNAGSGAVGELGGPEPGTLYTSGPDLLKTSMSNQTYQVFYADQPSAWSPTNLTLNNCDLWFTISNATVSVTGGDLVMRSGSRLRIGAPGDTNRQVLSVSGDATVDGSTLWLQGGGQTGVTLLAVGGNLTVTNGGVAYFYSGLARQINDDDGELAQVDGDVTVASGSSLIPYAYRAPAAGQTGGCVRLSVRNLTVDAGGFINADGAGYRGAFYYENGYGPGGSAASVNYGTGGGGFGGAGGAGNGTGGGSAYGSSNAPVCAGSGAGCAEWGRAYGGVLKGGSGGGLVRIEASQTLTINGAVSANGTTGWYWDWANGSGSGGGIYLRCHRLAGNGTLSAAGALGGAGTGGGYSGGGGGGRIAVYCADDRWEGAKDAATLAPGGNGPSSEYNGATGTVVWPPPPQSTLILLL